MSEADIRRQRAWSLVLSILLLTILFEAVALMVTTIPPDARVPASTPTHGAGYILGRAAATAAEAAVPR